MRGTIIGCGLLACVCPGVLGQSVTGNTYTSALCGNTTQQNAFFGCDIEQHDHGSCVSGEGPASINDASCLLRVTRGQLIVMASGQVQNFGTTAYGGVGEGMAQAVLTADDVVFTDPSNPTRTGTIQVSLNFILAAQIGTAGISNCNPSSPYAQAQFNVFASGGSATGSMLINGGGGVSYEGALVGYDNTGDEVIMSTPQGSASLLSQNQVLLQARAHGWAMYCNAPPADFGDGDSMVRLRLPCAGQVFNLPPHITVNSVQLGIVDNHWGGLAIVQQPFDAATCRAGQASFSVQAAGSGAIAYRWQIETVTDTWADLGDDPVPLDCGAAVAVGATTPNAQIGVVGCSATNPSAHRIRCVASNDCNTVVSGPVVLTICPADFDCSGFADLDDYVAFVQAFEAGGDDADFDGTGFVDLDDFVAYVHAFEVGC